MIKHSPFTWLTILLVVTAAACNPLSPPAPPTAVPTPAATAAPASTQPPTQAPTQPPTAAPKSGAVSSLEDVKKATIQIEAQGSFVDPQVGLKLNVAGRGSGFIIDPSGIAVTNNHVVTGAALLKVWVGGESQPRNAKILGVSECSDLAVIDIDGDGYPYLEWYDGKIATGLDVYAAGFPLGEPEFTLTRGIVSKERASGETQWASVDSVIEHDATINPGNSGGPLVTKEGKVVGINYASRPDAKQYFAIGRDEALKVIDQLRARKDVTSIGVNGIAVNDGQSIAGIWVASVKSGSPADKAGVKGGDIITKIEGLVLSTDGTMSDYCDILRSHDPEDTLSMEVLRFDTQEVLAGQLNGRPLAVSFSFAQQVEGETGGAVGAGTKYTDYVKVYNDSKTIKLEVPVEWSDTDGRDWAPENENVGPAISAAPNLDEFYKTYSTPGVFFAASRVMAQKYNETSFLDSLEKDSNCTYDGRYDYSDELYTGVYDLFTDCGSAKSLIIRLAAVPKSRAFLMYVYVQVVTEADLDALDAILKSFEVVGNLP